MQVRQLTDKPSPAQKEFIGVMFVDDEDDDKSYNFQMAILETDLDDPAA